MNPQERTEAQLLADFEGVAPEQLKTLNLIFSLFRAIEGAEGPPAGAPVADAEDENDVVAQFNALLASLRANGVLGV